jgi:hypothetical protein
MSYPRAIVVTKIHKLYESERATKAEELKHAMAVALTGDHWTSVCIHNYLGVTAHHINKNWKLHSHAMAIMKTEDMDLAKQWNIENKVTTVCTDSARNIIAASRHMPFEHLPCIAHCLQMSITVSLQNSGVTF